MSTEKVRAYPLRRSRSPSRYNASPMTRRKLKAVSDEQDVYDEVNVTTYNDNPDHLFGLDKEESMILSNSIYSKSLHKTEKDVQNGNTPSKVNHGAEHLAIIHKEQKPLSEITEVMFRRSWYDLMLFIAFVMIVCEVVIWLDRWLWNSNKVTLNGACEFDENVKETLESLNKKLHTHLNGIEVLRGRVSKLEDNCTQENMLNDDAEQNHLISQLQEQILTTVNVVKSMNQKIEEIQLKLYKKKIEEENSRLKYESSLCQGEDCKLSKHTLHQNIQEALDMYHADVIAIPDFALESAGARIHSNYHSKTCEVGVPIIKIFGLPLWQDPRSPRSIINPENLAGNCWPMQGTQGYIVVKLATAIEPTMVTLEHLDERLDRYSTDSYLSSPKDFEVHAWLRSDGKEKLQLGSFTYVRKHSSVQIFKLQRRTTIPVHFVELKILSNYGNLDCTCIYRFRVHGRSYEWETSEDEEKNT